MKRLKGAQLKMPKLKVPPFLVDLYYDLHDRRLLPLVALVLVAIAAAPFLLSGDSEEAPPPVAGISASPGTAVTGTARLTVVEAKPGLRDYRKRLKGRTPTDPFKQRYSGPIHKGGQLQEETATSETSSASGGEATTTSPPATSEAPPSSSPPSDGSAGSQNPPSVELFTFAIDVQIAHTETTKAGGRKMGEPTVKRGVLPTTPLPGEKAPVVTYMGLAPKGENLLLMVSNNVKTVLGDAKCLSGTDTCQLLEVEPGLPEEFVYGANDVKYRINILQAEVVPTQRSESAQQ
ncbi:MAG TPA: hypothetical protein VN758_12590 [Solirubrobacterales bacterium]|nr:hypothetical protein [Solirubrobacterales bacterium]